MDENKQLRQIAENMKVASRMLPTAEEVARNIQRASAEIMAAMPSSVDFAKAFAYRPAR